MSRLLKTLMLAVAGIVLLVVLSAAALLLFFDPNDFRDEIAAQVKTATGRELQIEGDLSVSVFPWLAVEVGRTRLGNAEGFDDEPFATFDSARLSVRLVPLVLRREIAVGTAELDALRLNLAINAEGVSNWDDLATAESAPAALPEGGEETNDSLAGLDIAKVEVRSAEINYSDAGTGSRYELANVSLSTGRIAFGEAFGLRAEFDFVATQEDLSGQLSVAGEARVDSGFGAVLFDDLVIDGTVNGIAAGPAELRLASDRLRADLDASALEPTTLELSALGVEVSADISELRWADAVVASAKLDVASFSPRELLHRLGSEPPATADPNALAALSFSADAAYGENGIGLRNMTMQLDDTTLQGELAVPPGPASQMRFELSADRLNLDRYMAPAVSDEPAAAGTTSDDFEIPVELIRSVNAAGTLQLGEAMLSGMRFSNVQLGLNAGNGKLRLYPLSAGLFDGRYTGDVRIDAAGAVPTLSLNEKVDGVSLTPLAETMFERDNISGTINGSFVLNASGGTLSAMRQKLNGTLSFELADGAWQGVDLWQQLRAARALYRREQPPEPRTPVKTDFSSVLMSGTVTDGIFRNDDLVADMPFLQLTGNGTVNLVAGEVDYALQARVLERPEFLRGASEEEIEEFTEALIPVRVRGPLTDPSVRPDIEAMFRKEVEDSLKEKGDELRDRLLQRLLPGEPGQAPAEGDAATDEADPEEQLKKRLKDLFDQ